MEHEAVFQIVSSMVDEYPGDGYRLKLVASPRPCPNPEQLADTSLLALLGFDTHTLKVGDEILVHAKLVSRLTTERKPV